ncbi:MAG: hypothetical protein AB1411_09485 [Nitrospirota bacterium]
MIRAALVLSTYLSGVWLFLFMACVMPGRALALVSPQAYARVVAEAEWIASVAAERGAMASAVGTAVCWLGGFAVGCIIKMLMPSH